MYKDAIMDELRQIELDMVEGERRLADLEAMRKIQLDREQNRQRLNSLVPSEPLSEVAPA